MKNIDEKSLSLKVIDNTLWNALGKFFSIAIGLFLPVYIINKIGLERYGIYTLIMAAGGYISMLDIGVCSSFGKYISEFYTLKDNKNINSLLNTGLVFYLFVGMLIFVLMFFGGNLILSFFKIPAPLKNEADFVLLMYSLILISIGIFSPFNAVLGGLQRMDVSNKLSIIINLFNLATTVIFLEYDTGLPGLLINNLLIIFVSSFIFMFFSFKYLPCMRINPFLFEKQMLKKIFNYGYKIQVTRLSFLMESHFEKVIIGRFLSPLYVAFYQLGNSVIYQARTIPLLLTSALMPAFSQIAAENRLEDMKEAYIRINKYLAFIAVPILGCVCALSFPLITSWMGPGYEPSGYIIAVLACGHLISMIFGAVGENLVQGMGKPEIQMKAAVLNLFLNAFLSFILIYKFGFSGAAIGTSLAKILSVFYFILLLHRLISLPVHDFLKKAFSKILFAGFAAFVAAFLFSFLSGKNLLSRFDGIVCLIEGGLIYSIIYTVILYKIKPFDLKDKGIFSKRKIPFLKFLNSFVA